LETDEDLMDHIYNGFLLCPGQRSMSPGPASFGNYITPNTTLLMGIISPNTTFSYNNPTINIASYQHPSVFPIWCKLFS